MILRDDLIRFGNLCNSRGPSLFLEPLATPTLTFVIFFFFFFLAANERLLTARRRLAPLVVHFITIDVRLSIKKETFRN